MDERAGGEGRFVLTGIRWEESTRRSNREMIEDAWVKKQNKRFLHPIIDWTEEDVWEFIRLRNCPYCPLYDQGHTRIGCIGCPAGGMNAMLRDFKIWPHYAKYYIHAFDDMVQARKDAGLWREGNWINGQEVFDWWIYAQGKGGKGSLCEGFADQSVLFE